MKFAVISPPQSLNEVYHHGLAYHMVLAQEAYRDSYYAKFYREMSRRGHFVILDNGAAEPEEERVSWSRVLTVANTLSVSEVALPDDIGDPQRSVGMTVEAASKSDIPVKCRMVIPHGESVQDWMNNLHNIEWHVQFRTIGVPKHMEDVEGGRVAILRRLQVSGYIRKYDVHLLGIRSDPKFECSEYSKQFPGVRGIDSGAPVAYAQAHTLITAKKHASLDWSKSADPTIVKFNIKQVLKWSNQCYWTFKTNTDYPAS